MIDTIQTKYGTAKNYEGYYIITSSKEGNNSKRLHRLIYEDYYKITLLDKTQIHHIDGDKTNNNISNLKMITMEEHGRLHSTGKHPSNKTRIKISKTVSKNNNTSGYYRVSKQKAKTSQGFTWKYTYYDNNGKRKAIYSINLNKLKEKVLTKGLEWQKLQDCGGG